MTRNTANKIYELNKSSEYPSFPKTSGQNFQKRGGRVSVFRILSEFYFRTSYRIRTEKLFRIGALEWEWEKKEMKRENDHLHTFYLPPFSHPLSSLIVIITVKWREKDERKRMKDLCFHFKRERERKKRLRQEGERERKTGGRKR